MTDVIVIIIKIVIVIVFGGIMLFRLIESLFMIRKREQNKDAIIEEQEKIIYELRKTNCNNISFITEKLSEIEHISARNQILVDTYLVSVKKATDNICSIAEEVIPILKSTQSKAQVLLTMENSPGYLNKTTSDVIQILQVDLNVLTNQLRHMEAEKKKSDELLKQYVDLTEEWENER